MKSRERKVLTSSVNHNDTIAQEQKKEKRDKYNGTVRAPVYRG